MASPAQNGHAFPALNEIQEEANRILHAKPTAQDNPLTLSPASSKAVAEGINHGIRANHNAAAHSEAASWFFASDNIGLPGFAIFFQTDAQVERNDAQFKANFLNRRGQHPSGGPTAGFSTNDFRVQGHSDPLHALATSLAINKTQYQKLSELYKVAVDEGDASGAFFISGLTAALTSRISAKAHYITHLKVVGSEKAAIKAVDARMPDDSQELAIAAGIEASIPARLQIGSVTRSLIQMTGTFTAGKDPAQEFRARRAFNQGAAI